MASPMMAINTDHDQERKARMGYVNLIRGNGHLSTLEMEILCDINYISFSKIFKTISGLEV